MRSSMTQFVFLVRNAIYVCLFLAVFLMQLMQWGYANSYRIDTNDSQQESEDFWPPDMIPHPGRPGEGPEKNEGDWAQLYHAQKD